MSDDYVQLAGKACTVCDARIATARDGRACATCKAVFHAACAAKHVCAGKPAEPAAPAVAARARSSWPYVGAVLGVVVAASIKPVIDHWQDTNAVRARVARDLRCAPEHVTVEMHGGTVRGTGCHDEVEYVVTCGSLGREDCLTMTRIPDGEVNGIIEERLGLHRR